MVLKHRQARRNKQDTGDQGSYTKLARMLSRLRYSVNQEINSLEPEPKPQLPENTELWNAFEACPEWRVFFPLKNQFE
jgi:hypothetical protein